MNRLLQGDAGSGKTVVALFAMALTESGYQSPGSHDFWRAALRTLSGFCRAAWAGWCCSRAVWCGRAAGRAAADRGGQCAHRHWHARPHPGDGRLCASRPGGDRRAAPIRRQAAARAGRPGRCAGCTGHVRDAHPSLARAHTLRRPGPHRARRAAAHAPAGPHRGAPSPAGDFSSCGRRCRRAGRPSRPPRVASRSRWTGARNRGVRAAGGHRVQRAARGAVARPAGRSRR
jgi:hypothetical protein